MSWLGKILPNAGKQAEERKVSVPEGVWRKCPKCDSVLYQAEVERNQHVCPKCDHHLRINARERLDSFLDRAAEQADIVFTCVGNDNDLRAVVLDENGLIHGLKAGSVLVDHSTVSAETSRELAMLLAKKGVDFVDAPVSGGQQGAQKGQLSIMCGATNAAVFAKIEPVLAYGKTITLMGDIGTGQLTKMVNQICFAGLIQALAEGINFAQKSGLDVAKALNVVSHGAASSWQMVNRYPTMLQNEYNHGFAVDWMRKDLDICLALDFSNARV